MVGPLTCYAEKEAPTGETGLLSVPLGGTAMGRELPSAAVVIYAVHNWVKYYCALQHKRNDLAENLGKLARKFSVFLGGLIAAHCSALH
jgi:hypothetical protein